MRQGIIAIVVKGNKVLMGKKVERPGHFLSNAWHFPGGKAEEGETPEAALLREMKEELNVGLVIQKKLCEYEFAAGEETMRNTVFICTTEEKPVAGDDLSDVRYFEREEILKLHHNYKTLPVEVKVYVDSLVKST